MNKLFTENPYAEYEIYSYNISKQKIQPQYHLPQRMVIGSTTVYEFDIVITNNPDMDIFLNPTEYGGMYILTNHFRYELIGANITSISYNSDQTMSITINSSEIIENAGPEWIKSILREESINKLLEEE